jgi:hypothetical protein
VTAVPRPCNVRKERVSRSVLTSASLVSFFSLSTWWFGMSTVFYGEVFSLLILGILSRPSKTQRGSVSKPGTHTGCLRASTAALASNGAAYGPFRCDRPPGEPKRSLPLPLIPSGWICRARAIAVRVAWGKVLRGVMVSWRACPLQKQSFIFWGRRPSRSLRVFAPR